MVRFEVASIFAVVGISGKAIGGSMLPLPPVAPVVARVAIRIEYVMQYRPKRDAAAQTRRGIDQAT